VISIVRPLYAALRDPRRCNTLALMASAKAPTKPLVRWSILVVRAKAVWLGDVEAASEAEAIAKGAEEFGQDPKRLMAVRR
jgi:hypothetical protein